MDSSIIPENLARLLVQGGPDLVRLCAILLASGRNPGGVVEEAQAVVDGKPFSGALPTGSPRPLTVVAWSFCQDPVQYGATYGLTAAEATEIRELIMSDRASGVARVREVVQARLRARGSPRPVLVSEAGIPGAPAAPGAMPTNDGGLKVLSQEIAKNPGVYGQYRFEAVATGRLGQEAFRVPLGGGVSAVGQSKRLAVCVARLVRVHGRGDPRVAANVRMWIGDKVRGPNGLPEDLSSGKAGPFAALLPDPVATGPSSSRGKGKEGEGSQ